MTNYDRGAAFERMVVADLRKHGYIAERVAGSHSPADIHAFKSGQVVFVQCKRDGRLSPDEWNGFLDYCNKASAVPVMASKAQRGISYHRLTAKKEKRGRQPMEVWNYERC